MVNRFKFIALSLALLGFALIASATQAGKAKPTANTVQGTVFSIDAAGGTVTLKDAGGAATVLNVSRKTKLTRNRKKVALIGLVSGDQAAAQYDSSNNIKQLSATGAAVSTRTGGVVGVHSGTGVVQLDSGSFGTNAHTRIIRNGQISTLGTLTAQDQVVAHVKPGGTASHGAKSTNAGGGTAIDVQVDGPEECEIEGAITAIDRAANTVTIGSEYGDWDVTVSVTPDTLIEVEGVEAPTIADLAVGEYVEVVYASDTQNAFRIEVENEEEQGYAEGPITAIDPSAGAITIDCYGLPVTLFVDASTKIEKDDEPALFADLKVGDEVMSEYNTATMIAKKIEVYSPEEEGDDD